MEKRWTILTADEEKIKELQSQLKIHPALCKILIQRGIENFDAAKKYFRPSLDELHDPWLMKDMDKAVMRITEAITNDEKILIYGDYDVDGTSSVALVCKYLRSNSTNQISTYIMTMHYQRLEEMQKKMMKRKRP